MSTITAAELAARVRANSAARLDAAKAQKFLLEWERRGIVEQPWPGSWRLTESGRAMFAGWADELDLEELAA